VAGLAIGVVVASSALGDEVDRPPAPSGSATTDWPTNADGLSFGSAARATSPQDEPDLIQAEATNGKVGYVLRTDLEGKEPLTPEEALLLQSAQAGKDTVIPVYKADGRTRIGVFVVSHDDGAGAPASN
jgi:hypothetical protein